MNKQIKFSHNWNGKLDNDIFTTIRRYTPEKYRYYMNSVGDPFDVVLKRLFHSNAILEGLFVAEKFSDIHSVILMLDTGMTDMTKIHKLFEAFGIRAKTKSIIPVFSHKKLLISEKSLLDCAVGVIA